MATVVPSHGTLAGETYPGFVHEGGRLERVMTALAREAAPRDPPQLLLDEWRHRVERLTVSAAPVAQ